MDHLIPFSRLVFQNVTYVLIFIFSTSRYIPFIVGRGKLVLRQPMHLKSFLFPRYGGGKQSAALSSATQHAMP